MNRKLILDFCRLVEGDPELKLAVSSTLGLQEVRSRIEELHAQLKEVAGEVAALRVTIERRFVDAETLQSLAAVADALRDRVAELTGEVRKLEAVVQNLSRELVAARVGSINTLEGLMRVFARNVFGAKVEEWSHYDGEGLVYGRPSLVRHFVLTRGDERLLLAARVCASRGDVYELWATGRLYERVTGERPRLVLVSLYADKGGRELAAELGVELHEVNMIEASAASGAVPPGIGVSSLR